MACALCLLGGLHKTHLHSCTQICPGGLPGQQWSGAPLPSSISLLYHTACTGSCFATRLEQARTAVEQALPGGCRACWTGNTHFGLGLSGQHSEGLLEYMPQHCRKTAPPAEWADCWMCKTAMQLLSSCALLKQHTQPTIRSEQAQNHSNACWASSA